MFSKKRKQKNKQKINVSLMLFNLVIVGDLCLLKLSLVILMKFIIDVPEDDASKGMCPIRTLMIRSHMLISREMLLDSERSWPKLDLINNILTDKQHQKMCFFRLSLFIFFNCRLSGLDHASPFKVCRSVIWWQLHIFMIQLLILSAVFSWKPECPDNYEKNLPHLSLGKNDISRWELQLIMFNVPLKMLWFILFV